MFFPRLKRSRRKEWKKRKYRKKKENKLFVYTRVNPSRLYTRIRASLISFLIIQLSSLLSARSIPSCRDKTGLWSDDPKRNAFLNENIKEKQKQKKVHSRTKTKKEIKSKDELVKVQRGYGISSRFSSFTLLWSLRQMIHQMWHVTYKPLSTHMGFHSPMSWSIILDKPRTNFYKYWVALGFPVAKLIQAIFS